MSALVFFIPLFLGMSGHSSAASYCLCKDGLSDAVLQKNIDYACGSGADCTPILQNRGCYQPNTVKAHCDYACNNYYQKKGQASGSCDFSGTASVASSLPTTVASGCNYPASPSQVTSTPISSSSPTSQTPENDSTAPSQNPNGSVKPSQHAKVVFIAAMTTLASGLLVMFT